MSRRVGDIRIITINRYNLDTYVPDFLCHFLSRSPNQAMETNSAKAIRWTARIPSFWANGYW